MTHDAKARKKQPALRQEAEGSATWDVQDFVDKVPSCELGAPKGDALYIGVYIYIYTHNIYIYMYICIYHIYIPYKYT